MKFRKTTLVLVTLMFLGLFSFASFVPSLANGPVISSKYLHMENGYLYYNLHFQSEQGMINQSNPLFTDWHEIYPEFSRRFRLINWEDTQLPGEPGYGEISHSDQIGMYDRETMKKYWYHVERVTVYLNVTLEPDRTRWMKIEFKGEKWEWEDYYQYEPWGTLWHEVYPVYSNVYKITSWEDNRTDPTDPGIGKVSRCDTIDMDNLTTPEPDIKWYHVEDVATGLILSRKKTEPVSTLWHELYPTLSNRYNLSGWEDTGLPIGQLSPSDQIDLTLIPTGPTEEYHVDNETITLNVTLGTTWMAIEFELPAGAPLEEMYLPITKPVCTLWYEVYPNFGKRYHLIGWKDNCDSVLSHCDYINLTDMETGETAQYHVEDVTNDIVVSSIAPPPPPPPMFWKANFTDYAPSGMPDFDQKQDLWNDSLGTWTWCAPVAVANSLWWMDSRYENSTTPPPTIKDTFPLVTNYTVGIDDHDPANVPLFIRHLAYLMDTDGIRTKIAHTGTNVFDMQTGIAQYLSWTGLNPKGDVNGDGVVNMTDWSIVNAALGSAVVGGVPIGPWNMAADIWPVTLGWPKPGVADNVVNGSDLALVTANMNKTGKFYEQTVKAPDFYFVEKEVERSEDVTLLLGFWQLIGSTWYRYDYPYPLGSGHAVTVAGVNSTTLQIAISDPIQDNAEPPPQGTSGPGRVLPPPPHPHTGIPETLHNNATYVSHDIYNVTLGPVPPPPTPPAGNWSLKNYASPQYPGKWIAVVEWAVIVSPLPPVGVHDVAVTGIKLKRTVVGTLATGVKNGYTLIWVNVSNQGVFTESFSVTIYYKNSTGKWTLATKPVNNLAAGASIKNLEFRWDTPGLTAYTRFSINATASVVPGEVDRADNTRVEGTLTVTIGGDADADGEVYIGDLGELGKYWRAKQGTTKYKTPGAGNADIDCDSEVYVGDLGILGRNWRKKVKINP